MEGVIKLKSVLDNMPETFDFFNSIEHLEPKCPRCGIVLDYGINTKFDDKKKAHICLKCKSVLK